MNLLLSILDRMRASEEGIQHKQPPLSPNIYQGNGAKGALQSCLSICLCYKLNPPYKVSHVHYPITFPRMGYSSSYLVPIKSTHSKIYGHAQTWYGNRVERHTNPRLSHGKWSNRKLFSVFSKACQLKFDMNDSNVAQSGLTKSRDSIIEASIPFHEREDSRKLSGCGLQNKF